MYRRRIYFSSFVIVRCICIVDVDSHFLFYVTLYLLVFCVYAIFYCLSMYGSFCLIVLLCASAICCIVFVAHRFLFQVCQPSLLVLLLSPTFGVCHMRLGDFVA